MGGMGGISGACPFPLFPPFRFNLFFHPIPAIPSIPTLPSITSSLPFRLHRPPRTNRHVVTTRRRPGTRSIPTDDCSPGTRRVCRTNSTPRRSRARSFRAGRRLCTSSGWIFPAATGTLDSESACAAGSPVSVSSGCRRRRPEPDHDGKRVTGLAGELRHRRESMGRAAFRHCARRWPVKKR
jgi:hypothetical protein